ncbi:DNA invertase Pin-like site-specific DNA recombinase [Burkholderia ambifaria]|uniref:recombinase family protein n=1 Tax=Burkholderia pyrrocinia TaxID=60550 RepID=UPI00158DD241|nr:MULTISPECIES: recombinase family protein [Burkholderia cepacia complex]MDR6502156.1 DNA invertase Pin-like site-specific DNA recombinase [Burkholderia ambifaria]
MKMGYARVSTEEQNLALQQDALLRAGCTKLFTDRGVSGTGFSRPGLDRALARLSAGDTLVVWRLDRLGRSLSKLIDLIAWLGRHGIGFVSLSESIDTTSAGGLLMFHMMAALSEFEHHLISERTRAGILAARARGRTIGRKPSLTDAQRNQVIALLETTPIGEVARRFNVHPRTVRRAIHPQRGATQPARSD